MSDGCETDDVVTSPLWVKCSTTTVITNSLATSSISGERFKMLLMKFGIFSALVYLCKTLYCYATVHESTVNCVMQSAATVVLVSKCLSKQHSHFTKSIQKPCFHTTALNMTCVRQKPCPGL